MMHFCLGKRHRFWGHIQTSHSIKICCPNVMFISKSSSLFGQVAVIVFRLCTTGVSLGMLRSLFAVSHHQATKEQSSILESSWGSRQKPSMLCSQILHGCIADLVLRLHVQQKTHIVTIARRFAVITSLFYMVIGQNL